MSETRSKRAAVVAAALATAGLAGCLPAATSPMDGGTNDGAVAVTYTKDTQPIFMAKCSPCHAGQSQGQHNIAINYADVHKPVQSLDAMGCWDGTDPTTGNPTMPKPVGECALVSIKRGWMPMGVDCFSMPQLAACVSPAEQDVIAAWIAAGMPQ